LSDAKNITKSVSTSIPFNVAVNGKFCAAEKEGVLRIAGFGAGSGGSKHDECQDYARVSISVALQ
jgi:hypothetical protein